MNGGGCHTISFPGSADATNAALPSFPGSFVKESALDCQKSRVPDAQVWAVDRHSVDRPPPQRVYSPVFQVDVGHVWPSAPMTGRTLSLDEYELWFNRGQKRIQLLRDIVFDRGEVRIHDINDARWKLIKFVEVCSLRKQRSRRALGNAKGARHSKTAILRVKYLDKDQWPFAG